MHRKLWKMERVIKESIVNKPFNINAELFESINHFIFVLTIAKVQVML